MKSTKKGLLLVIISGIVFGIMPSAVTYCYSQGANKLLVMFFRYLTLSIVLLPSILKQGGIKKIYFASWKSFLLLSLTGVCTPLLLFSAYSLLPTSLVTTIHFLYPTVVAILCVLIFHEKLSKLKLTCLILCISGILLMLDVSGQNLSAIGLVIALASSLTWASYIVILDKLNFHEASSRQIMFCVSINGVLLSMLISLFTGSFRVSIPAVGWLAMIGASLLISVCGSLFFSIGVRQTDAQVSAIASTLEPITSIVVGVLFLHEGITLRTAIGAVCILAAVILLSVFEGRKS